MLDLESDYLQLLLERERERERERDLFTSAIVFSCICLLG